jgi:hypothetical protein
MGDKPYRHPDLGDPDEAFLLQTKLDAAEHKRLMEKHLGTAEEIAFHQRMGRVTKIDLDAGTFTVTVRATEKDLRRISRYMLSAEVVRVVLPESEGA